MISWILDGRQAPGNVLSLRGRLWEVLLVGPVRDVQPLGATCDTFAPHVTPSVGSN